MNNLVNELAELDKLIHEPARLVILTALSVVKSVDFLFLQNLTGLTAGNLSGHLTRLEEAGLVHISKEIVGKRPKTTLRRKLKGSAGRGRHAGGGGEGNKLERPATKNAGNGQSSR
jgi:DNA-binding transcriptional ArsR family regulator